MKQHHDFFGINESNDFYYAVCCLDYLLARAQIRGTTHITAWSDNGI